MRGPLSLIALVLATAAAVVLISLPVTSSAATRPSRCSNITFTPNSGDGLFDITARSISCRAARAKLTAAHGVPSRLTGWRCRVVRRYEIGSERYACRSRVLVHARSVERVIAFTTGN